MRLHLLLKSSLAQQCIACLHFLPNRPHLYLLSLIKTEVRTSHPPPLPRFKINLFKFLQMLHFCNFFDLLSNKFRRMQFLEKNKKNISLRLKNQCDRILFEILPLWHNVKSLCQFLGLLGKI